MKTAAIILAAGKPSDIKTPKPLIHIGGKSMLAYEIDTLDSVPVDEIAVVVGYKDSIVKKHLENYRVTIAANRHFSETEMLVPSCSALKSSALSRAGCLSCRPTRRLSARKRAARFWKPNAISPRYRDTTACPATR